MLNALCEAPVEVVDLSAAGMFAPEYLQRLAAMTELGFDVALVSVAYISFSDRMPLARQSLSARSMWQPAVRSKLPAGFWLRNYDIGLFADALIAQHWRSYRHRNAARDRLERPMLLALNRIHRHPFIRFLEADEHQFWRFPDGFDRNLFQWRLYQSDRDRHLADMGALLELARRHGLAVLAFNLPIHWEKEPRPVDAEDVASYRATLRKLFTGTEGYIDYEGEFPKAMSTYDALHPTWHGARLHAFDMALRLQATRLECEFGEPELLRAFKASDSAVSAAYRRALDGDYPPPTEGGFRRLDVSEPANARNILRRFAGYPVESAGTQRLLTELAVRIRYWVESEFPAPDQSPWSRGVRAKAYEEERRRFVERVRHFVAELARSHRLRLLRYPLPRNSPRHFVSARDITMGGVPAVAREYLHPNGLQMVEILDKASGRRFSILVIEGHRTYERVDVLGDGSFLQLYLGSSIVHVPHWVRHRSAIAGFGA